MAEIASLDDLRIRFGTSTPRRQFLFRQLEIVIDQLLITRSVKQIYLFGSFVSGKASPNDVDLLVVMNAGFSTTQLGGKVLELFQHDVCRIRYHADLFWVTRPLAMLGLKTCWKFSLVTVKAEPNLLLRLSYDSKRYTTSPSAG